MRIENVYILPGIPSLFEKILTLHSDHFVGTQIERIYLFTSLREGDIAPVLSEVQQHHPHVKIGSCLAVDGSASFNVQVSIEGPNEDSVHTVANLLRKHLPHAFESTPH